MYRTSILTAVAKYNFRVTSTFSMEIFQDRDGASAPVFIDTFQAALSTTIPLKIV